MKKIKEVLPFILAQLIIFYAFPLFIKDTGSGMFIMLAGIPLATFVNACIHGKKCGFVWWYALTTILFIPSVYLYFNESAMIYTVVYFVIALGGDWIGAKYCD